MATPSSTILVRCGEAQSARNNMRICGPRRPPAEEAAVPRESDPPADSPSMDRAFILSGLTLTMFAIAGNSLAALARGGGNDLKTQSNAFWSRKISADPLHVRRVRRQYIRAGNSRKAPRPEKGRTRIGKCRQIEMACCTIRPRSLGTGDTNPDTVTISRFGANTGNSTRSLRGQTG